MAVTRVDHSTEIKAAAEWRSMLGSCGRMRATKP